MKSQEQLKRERHDTKLRRIGYTRGFDVRKCPRRDTLAVDYGLFSVRSIRSKKLVHRAGLISDYALSREQVQLVIDGHANKLPATLRRGRANKGGQHE